MSQSCAQATVKPTMLLEKGRLGVWPLMGCSSLQLSCTVTGPCNPGAVCVGCGGLRTLHEDEVAGLPNLYQAQKDYGEGKFSL